MGPTATTTGRTSMRYVPAVTPLTLNVNVAISFGATTGSLCTAGRPGCGQLTAIFGSKFALLPTNARLASDPVPRAHATFPVFRNLNVMVASAPIETCAGALWSIHALSRSDAFGRGAWVGVGVACARGADPPPHRPNITMRTRPIVPAKTMAPVWEPWRAAVGYMR